mgnify:CR=1 FL=1
MQPISFNKDFQTFRIDTPSSTYGISLVNAGGEANGKYIVENVTDVVTVNATFKKSSAVDDIYSSRVRIYPNPVDDLLTIESEGNLTDAVIYNASCGFGALIGMAIAELTLLLSRGCNLLRSISSITQSSP